LRSAEARDRSLPTACTRAQFAADTCHPANWLTPFQRSPRHTAVASEAVVTSFRLS
jgi:hypothetical protein